MKYLGEKNPIIPLGVFVCMRTGMERGGRGPYMVSLHATMIWKVNILPFFSSEFFICRLLARCAPRQRCKWLYWYILRNFDRF